MGRLWKTASAGVGVVVLSVGAPGAAWAHECFNASRSAKGDAKAAESQAWTLISDIILMYAIPDELGADPLTPAQLAAAQAIVANEKASGDEALEGLYAADRAVLMTAVAMNGNSRDGYTELSDDGRAIEHIFADMNEILPLFDHLIGIYQQVSA